MLRAETLERARSGCLLIGLKLRSNSPSRFDLSLGGHSNEQRLLQRLEFS